MFRIQPAETQGAENHREVNNTTVYLKVAKSGSEKFSQGGRNSSVGRALRLKSSHHKKKKSFNCSEC